MSETKETPVVVEVEPAYPIVVRLGGLPIAKLHADGSVEGRIDALETVMAGMKARTDDLPFRLWMILNALKNQKILR